MDYITIKFKGDTIRFTSSQLDIIKYLAVILMTIDHTGAILFDAYHTHLWTAYLGRIAFPLFAFLAVYHFIYNTSDQIKYIQRIFIFALISQIPYMLSINEILDRFTLNILFTLSGSLFFIVLYEEIIPVMEPHLKTEELRSLKYVVWTIFGLFFMFLDSYGISGFLLIMGIYWILKKDALKGYIITLFSLLFLNIMMGFMAVVFTFLSIVTLGSIHQSTFKLQRIDRPIYFYIYYPVHLLFLSFIGDLM